MSEKYILTDYNFSGNKIIEVDARLLVGSFLRNEINSMKITNVSGDNSVLITDGSFGAGATNYVRTTIKVKLKPTTNDIKSDTSGLYVIPYTALKSENPPAGADVGINDTIVVDSTKKTLAVSTAYHNIIVGLINTAAEELLGTTTDASTKITIYGGRAYTDVQIAAAIESLDYEDTAVENKFVTEVDEVDGVIAVTRARPKAANISVVDAAGYFTGTDVETVLAELYTQAGSGSAVSVHEVTPSTNVLKSYGIYQGIYNSSTPTVHLVGTIDIPKDLVISSGSLVYGEWINVSGTQTFYEVGQNIPSLGRVATDKDTALKLVIANQTDPIYINTTNLVDVYKGGAGINVASYTVTAYVKDTDKYLELTSDDTGTGKKWFATKGIDDAISTAITDLEDIIDAYTVNGYLISTNPVLNLLDLKLTTAYSTPSATWTDADGATHTVTGVCLAGDTGQEAIRKLDLAIATESGARQAQDSIITNKLNTEITDRTTADTALSERIDALVASATHQYVVIVASTANYDITGDGTDLATYGGQFSIASSVHNCGSYPLVQVSTCGASVIRHIDSEVWIDNGNLTVKWYTRNGTGDAFTQVMIIVQGKPSAILAS